MALLVLCSVSSFAQNTAGKDFWFAQTINLADKNGDIAILISNKSTSQTTVTITNPVRGTITRTLGPAGTTNSIDSVFLTSENLAFFDNVNNTLVPKTSGTFVNNVYHITATNDIVAYAFTPWVNVISNDASLLIPTNSLGRKYFAGSYVSATPVNAYNSFFGIIATEDGTTVDIYNKTNSANPASVSPTSTITLNKGQYYQYLNGNTQANDVTGWYLQANKNINVVSGNQCTNVGTAASCDHIEEQLLPVENLAKTYIASPSRTRGTIVNNVVVNAVPDIFRVVASEDGTSVTTNLNATTYNLNRGQFVDILSSVPFKIEGTKPIYAYQIFASQNSNYTAQGYGRQGTVGDPSMVVVPLIDQFLYTYTFINGQTYPTNYVNITAPVGTNILLDGAPLPANTTWTTAGTVNGVTYQCANVRVSASTHKIEGDQRFGITTYGWGDFASYGYLGGSGMQPINAGCITGGPYQLLSCTTSPTYAIQLNGTASCETPGVTPIISWTSTNPQVTFSNSTIVNPIVTVPGAGTYSITMRVTCGGNTVSCTTDVIVREPVVLGGCTSTNPPNIQAPPTVIVPSDANQNYASNVVLGNAVTNVPAGPGVVTNNAPSQFPFGESTVVWTVTDAFGRTASANQTVIVVPPPTIVAPPAITVSNDPGETYATITNIGIATYTSDYGPDVLSSNAPANNQYPLGTTTVTWTIKDGFNRTASATQTITVTTPPPTIVAPATINVVAGYNGFATVASLGTPTTTVSVNPETVTNAGTLAQYPIGTTNITWTVTDGLGRTASDVQQVIVSVPAPQITPPADITISNDPGEQYSTQVTLVNPVYQAVGPVTLTNDAPAQFPLGTTTVTWTLTDAYGNTVITTNKVTVTSVAPTIVAPPTITVTAGYNGFATVNDLRANGNETVSVSVNPATVTNNNSSNQYAIGTTNITWTVTDGINRTASDVQQVIVLAPLPKLNPVPDVTVPNNPGVNYATVTLAPPTYEAIGPVTLTNDAPAQFPIGTTIVTWTLTDVYGKTTTTTQKVTVTSAAPTIVAPPAITVTAGYNGFATVNDLRANGNETVSVSVNPATVTNNNSSTQYAIGTTNITWTVTDGLGRTASDVQQVIVLAPLPKLNPVPDVTVPNNPGVNYATVTLVPPTYEAIGPVTLTNDAPAQFPIGTTVVTWTLTDAYGKTTTTTQKVTVTSAPPTIVPPANITVTAAAGQTSATITNIGTATYTVSVNPATLTKNAPVNNVYSVGTTTVTWTVTDGLGRTASGNQTITVNPAAACNFVSSITSIPTDNTPTGGNPKNLYIGYGAQSTKLQVNVPNTGGPYTFLWTGTGLSSTTSAAPIFSPGTTAGNYTFTVSVKNGSGCTSTATISICVRDVRSLDKKGNWDGKKVIVCHLPPGNVPNVQYIDVSINAVPTHVPNHGGDGLGNSCVQPSCNSPYARGVAPTAETFAVNVYPNPTAKQFALTVKSEDKFTDIDIRIIDAFGRTVEVMKGVAAGRTVLFGEKYANGAYYAEVIQGSDKKVIPMVKAN
jgi:hypothetical protein